MAKKEKELFKFSEQTRLKPKWMFWNKTQQMTITCVNDGCDFKKVITNRYNGAMQAALSMYSTKVILALHADDCEFKPKPKKKTAAKKPAAKTAKKK